MGNTQSDDKVDKVISTVWLGVNVSEYQILG